MTMQATTLRPGLLVALSTRVSGNVTYTRRDIETGRVVANGAVVSKWETERTVTNAEEADAASKARGKCRTLISSVCAQSEFGLLCPEDDAGKLDRANRRGARSRGGRKPGTRGFWLRGRGPKEPSPQRPDR